MTDFLPPLKVLWPAKKNKQTKHYICVLKIGWGEGEQKHYKDRTDRYWCVQLCKITAE